jgi:hypothetical protein
MSSWSRSTRPREKPRKRFGGRRIALSAWKTLTPYFRTDAARTMNSPTESQIGTESLVEEPGPKIGPPRANPPAPPASAALLCAAATSRAAPVMAFQTLSTKSRRRGGCNLRTGRRPARSRRRPDTLTEFFMRVDRPVSGEAVSVISPVPMHAGRTGPTKTDLPDH